MVKPTYESILRAKRKTVADLEETIRVVNLWNGTPQAHGNTIDVEPERIALHYARESVALWEAGRTIEAAEPWDRVIDALESAANPGNDDR